MKGKNTKKAVYDWLFNEIKEGKTIVDHKDNLRILPQESNRKPMIEIDYQNGDKKEIGLNDLIDQEHIDNDKVNAVLDRARLDLFYQTYPKEDTIVENISYNEFEELVDNKKHFYQGHFTFIPEKEQIIVFRAYDKENETHVMVKKIRYVQRYGDDQFVLELSPVLLKKAILFAQAERVSQLFKINLDMRQGESFVLN